MSRNAGTGKTMSASPVDGRFINWRQLAAKGNVKVAKHLASMELLSLCWLIHDKKLYFSRFILPELTKDADEAIFQVMEKAVGVGKVAGQIGRGMDFKCDSEALKAEDLEVIIEQIVACEQELGKMTAALSSITNEHIHVMEDLASQKSPDSKEVSCLKRAAGVTEKDISENSIVPFRLLFRNFGQIADYFSRETSATMVASLLLAGGDGKVLRTVLTENVGSPLRIGKGQRAADIFAIQFDEKMAVTVSIEGGRAEFGMLPLPSAQSEIDKVSQRMAVRAALRESASKIWRLQSIVAQIGALRDAAAKHAPDDSQAEPTQP